MAKEYESAAEKLEALMDGSFDYGDSETEESSDESEVVEEVEEEIEPEEVSETNEDTDQEETETEEEESEPETNEHDNGNAEETDEETDEEVAEEPEENAPVDDDNGEEPAVEGKTETDDAVTEKDPDADPDTDLEVVDYQKKYEELLTNSEQARTFYDKATSEFQANGKTVKGFSDPEKVIQSQQMAYGFNDKMSTFKKYKPFLKELQSQGFLDDPSKFDLVMNMASGDQEAIKQFMKTKEIDPLDFDMEEVKYAGQSRTASPIELALDDVLDNAQRNGVHDEMERLLAKDWDSESVVKMLERPQDSAVLVSHLQKGDNGISIYDAVQERISEKKRTDVSGEFSGVDAYTQYMVASRELDGEYQDYVKEHNATQQAEESADKVEAEKKRISQGNKNEQYKKQAAKKEESAKQARAKATSVSKPKPKTRRVKKEADPMKLSGDSFQDYFNKEILGLS